MTATTEAPARAPALPRRWPGRTHMRLLSPPRPGDRALMLQLAARIHDRDNLRLLFDALGLRPVPARYVRRRGTGKRKRRLTPRPRYPRGVRTRPCTSCGKFKEADEYWADARNPDGLRSECKTCFRTARGSDPDGRHPRQPREPAAEQTCSRCGETKPAEQFYKDGRRPNGRRSECKTCFDNARKGVAA